MLAYRIAHLLAARGARPGEVLAITFTNKAAAEMRERVEALVGPRARTMWVSTFHSAAVRILRYESSRLGLRSGFSIYDAADTQRLVGITVRDLDLDPKRYPARALAGPHLHAEERARRPRRRTPPRWPTAPPTSSSCSTSTAATPGGCARRTPWTSTT